MIIDRSPDIDLTSKATGGETASWSDVAGATLQSELLTHTGIGRAISIDRAYDKRVDDIKAATGVELQNPLQSAQDPRDIYYPRADRPAYDPQTVFKRDLEALAEQHPEAREIIAPDRPIAKDAGIIAKKAEERAEDVWDRSEKGAAAWSARLAGGAYAALHDPVQVGTIALGGGPAGAGVRGLAWMAMKQAAANAGTEAAIQPFVQSWRKEAGLDYGVSQAAIDIAAAGAFGAAADAGVRSAWRGVRQLRGDPYRGPDADGARLPEMPQRKASSSPLNDLDTAARAAPEGSVLRKAAAGDEEALRAVAKDIGLDKDPATRRMLDEIDIDKLFTAPLNVDDGAHLETLARAIRSESGAPELPAGAAIAAPVRRQIAEIADEAVGRALEVEGKPVGFRAVDPREVTTDAAAFQFKSGGDNAGVTDRLRGVSKWDPVSAGKAIVFERADGQLVIADGHQRLGLAQRLAGDQNARLDAYVFREADGWKPEDVRAYAALKNMRELSGSPVDMAQVMRDRPDLVDGSLPLTDAKLKDATNLARLSPEAFDAVVAGRLEPRFAAMIGEAVPDAGRHFDLLNEMAAAGLQNPTQARLYLKQLMELPTTTETQMTLFGEEAFTRSVMLERAQVLDSALKALKADKRIFGLLEDKARTIEGAGNVLARETNAAKAENAAQLAELIETLATSRGTVATILNDAAASVARGLDSKLASRAFVDRIASTLEREGLAGLTRVDEAPAPDLAPVRMEEPNGPEAKAQTEEINWALELDDEIRFALASRPPLPDEQRFSGERELLLPYSERWGNPRFDPADKQRALDRITEIGGLDPKAAAWTDLIAARNDLREISSQLLYYNRDVTPEEIDSLIDEVWHYGHERAFPEEAADMRPSIFSATDLVPEVAVFVNAMRPVLDRLYSSKRPGLSEMMLRGKGDEPTKRKKTGPEPERIGETRGGFFFKAGRELENVPDALFRQGGQAVIDHLTQAGVKKAEIKHFGLDEFTSKKSVTREEFAQTIAERVFEFRRKTSWFNPESNRMDYEAGGTRAFSGPRIPGRGIYFERLMAFPKKLKGGEDFAPGHFESPHWDDELAGTWGSWRGSVRDVPDWGRMVIGEEGQSDLMQGASSGRRPRVKGKEFLEKKQEQGRVALTPETPIDESWVRTMARDLLLQAAAKKADSIAVSTSDTTARIQNNAKAAHFYDQQMKPALERELRRITGDGTLTLEKIALPKPMGGKKEKPYTVWAAKLAKEVVKTINEEGQPMFSVATHPATLRDTTLSVRAAERMAAIRGEIDSAIDKALPPGWRAEVRERLVFGDLSDATQKRNPGVAPGLELEATFDPYERIIYVSMAATDPVERVWEEVGHALKASKLIPDADYAILRGKAAEIGARERFDIDARYGEVYGARYKDNPGRLEEALEEEAIMQMVAARARGESFDKPTNGILDKLLKFLHAVRDVLTGKGLRNFEDVFADISEGRLAGRSANETGGDAMASYAGDGVMSTAFKRWFGDSKVVDAQGKPLVVYHGTGADIDSFRKGNGAGSRESRIGFWFTENRDAAGEFADFAARGSGANVTPVYLRMENPLEVENYNQIRDLIDGFTDFEKPDYIVGGRQIRMTGDNVRHAELVADLRAKGHDGIVLRNTLTDSPDGVTPITQYVVFEPTQIKSATGNRGTFDPNDPRISFALPGTEHDAFLAKAEAAQQIMFALPSEGKGPQLPGGRAAKQVRDLINQAAAAGHLARDEADGLIERYNMLEQFHKDGGKAKQQIAKELSAEAEHRKRQKALAEIAKRRVQNALISFRDARGQADPAKAMQALIENLGQHELPQGMTSVANHQHAIFGMALAQLDGMLHEFRKTVVTGQTRNKARLSNVVRELFGEKTDDEMAAGFAMASAQVMDDLRMRFNAAGGAIPKRKNWGLPQWHDQVALRNAGKQAWVEFVTPLLDAKWMKHPLTGDDMSPGDVKRSLEDTWESIVSDGWHDREAEMGRRGLSAIANTRGDARSLVFANADAWMKYSERFGGGPDALGIIVNHIKSMSTDIAAMEVLGPNPANMLKFMQDFVTQQAKLRRAGLDAVFPSVREVTGLNFRDPTSYARAMNSRVDNMWGIYSGLASAPVNAEMANFSQGVRNLNVATKLGGAAVPAIGDLFWQAAARKFAGLPVTAIFKDVFSQIKAGGEREARRSGVIAETYMHMHNEGAREAAALSFSGVTGFMADRVLSLSMLNSITRAGNHAMGMGIQSHLADLTAKPFGELASPVQRMLRRYGLEASDWDALRLDGAGNPRQGDFLSPAAIRADLVARGLDGGIAERYLAAIIAESQYATLTGTIRARAITTFGTRTGTAGGEVVRHLLQFKGFAVNLAILQLERMAREFVSQGFSRGAQFGAYALTSAVLGGALITQLQQLRNGKDPQSMDPSTSEGAKFWVRGLIQSGGLSIWGDLLSAAENRHGGGVAGTLAGPTAGTLQDLANLTTAPASKQVRRLLGSDEKTTYGREVANFVRRYTPGSSLWYVRTAWERVLMDNLQRMLDPEADASFRRKIQNARKDYRQDFWWKPGGGAVPQRGPRLEAVFPTQ